MAEDKGMHARKARNEARTPSPWAALMRAAQVDRRDPFRGDPYLLLANVVIDKMQRAKADLSVPERAASARAMIERASIAADGDKDTRDRRLRTMRMTLDFSLDCSPETRAAVAAFIFRVMVPASKVSRAVVARAVELWPHRGPERTAAVRALAGALDCDSRSLLNELSQARGNVLAKRRRKTE
jgi:hypothetical protein